MADPIVWTPTRTTLRNALSPLSPADPARITGQAVLAHLEASGSDYDAHNTTALRARMTAEQTAHDAALTDWALTARTGMAAAYAEADRVARYAEQLQVAAQTGLTLEPRVAALEDGTRYVLAPESALPFPSPYVEVPAPTVASRTLSQGATAVLRVLAKVPGLAGTQVQVQVSQASDEVASRFTLSVRLGGYVETYQNLDCSQSGPVLGSQASSLLIATLERVGVGRPDDAAFATLGGGAGAVMENLRDRAGRAQRLPAGSSVERRLVAACLTTAEQQWARKPVYTSRLAAQEAALTAALAAATAMLGFLGWTTP